MPKRQRTIQKPKYADVVGVGNNATDTIIQVPHFPRPGSKVSIEKTVVLASGQVASAMVACRRWGLKTRYIGKIGSDTYGQFQVREMSREGVEAHWSIASNTCSQSAFILVDSTNGERTVLWKREANVALEPGELKRGLITRSKVLLVDGHDTRAATQAARWARAGGVLVVGDFDNRYPGVKRLLPLVDFPVMSQEFPERLTGRKNLLEALPYIKSTFRCHMSIVTLGPLGVLAWSGERFLLCRGFKVRAVDTTGAGDIFHGAFIYGLVKRWPVEEVLEFSCAAAALNCTAVGARGGISSLRQVSLLRRRGRRSERAFSDRQLHEAAAKSHKRQTS